MSEEEYRKLCAEYRLQLESLRRGPGLPAGFTPSQVRDLFTGFEDGLMAARRLIESKKAG